MNRPYWKHRGTGDTSRSVPRWLISLAVAAVLSFGLSGCLLNRVGAVKEQFCDFDSNFTVHSGDTTDFLIHHPVLLDSDILWMSGASPSSISMSNGQLKMTFEIEKVMPIPDPASDMEIRLFFDRVNDDFKLRHVQLDEKLGTIISPDLMDPEMMMTAVQNVCDAGLNFASTRMDLDITEREIELLPSRAEMFELLGAPSETIEPGKVYAYEYRIKSDQKNEQGKIARLVVWFDESGASPLRMESHYSRYQTHADFVTRKMQLKVNI